MNKPKKLSDTVDLMLSQDYKERFQAEYYQAKIRHDKLQAMIRKWDNGDLPFTPACPKVSYKMQLKNQEEFLALMTMRARMEGISIEEFVND